LANVTKAVSIAKGAVLSVCEVCAKGHHQQARPQASPKGVAISVTVPIDAGKTSVFDVNGATLALVGRGTGMQSKDGAGINLSGQFTRRIARVTKINHEHTQTRGFGRRPNHTVGAGKSCIKR